MIKLKNLSFTYPNSPSPTLDSINLHIHEGDFVLLMGTSGAGKSTLLRCLNGLVPHFSGGTISGQLSINGLNPVEATPQVMSRHVGFVFQEPEAQFVMDRVEDEIAFALENAAFSPQEMRIRVEEVLDMLDLAPLRARSLETLSGGEKQRVAIAATLVLRPRVLILDEPTSQLDPKSAEDVLQALVRLNSDLGLTILLAEHRLERVLPYIDSLLYLPAIEYGDPSDILAKLDLNQVPPLIALGKAFNWQPLPLSIKQGRRFSHKALLCTPIKETEPWSAKQRFAYLVARNLRMSYDNQQAILKGIDISVRAGEIVVLMGRNGAGKSSLLKSLIGLCPIQGGEILLNGDNIVGQPVATIAQKIGYLPQDPNALLFANTVRDEFEITLRNHGLLVDENDVNNRIDELFEILGLSNKSAAYPRDLSVGERQRVALGAIMVIKPKVLLLDEPTRGLDYLAKRRLSELLRQWRDEGIAILLVTHDVELAAQVAERVVLMSQGEIIADGAPRTVLGHSPQFAPQVARLFPETGWLTVEDVLGFKV
jgi:energy-coupling factor transport system ATP-binding protein